MSNSSKLTLYTAPTPNGHPVSVFLEELGIPYETVRMSISDSDIGKVHNQVKSPWYLEINPNGRIPAITHDGFHVFETSAILLYLQATFDKENKFGASAEKDPRAYSEIVQWMCFAHGGIGPMQGQANHFKRAAPEQIPYAINRYVAETRRLYSVLESRLSTRDYLVGDRYTIADIKTVTWVRFGNFLEIDMEKEFPRVKAWIARIEARPAVQQGLKVPA
ncbi:glutathione S-transferase [Mycena galopus ATCC 62051]|nr:glutathione S-transferase [Mycena galopus ATCC 62051]KAF8175620.1 glutathione S-transferase [Mycena galopus ATCC 62051]